ncbi:MAG: hypothetical protein SGJ18_15175 [Pseudomonadota bacterium]|nr:hypothetical protein [Pseudomonadota bacterium]
MARVFFILILWSGAFGWTEDTKISTPSNLSLGLSAIKDSETRDGLKKYSEILGVGSYFGNEGSTFRYQNIGIRNFFNKTVKPSQCLKKLISTYYQNVEQRGGWVGPLRVAPGE